MGANNFGTFFKVTTFGESHGQALGCVIDGCPAGICFDMDMLKSSLKRRRPGNHANENVNENINKTDNRQHQLQHLHQLQHSHQLQLQHSHPHQLHSERKETDEPRVLSGIFEGFTIGTPIAIIIENEDQRSQDYIDIKSSPRLGHVDDLWEQKFSHRDWRGGGRASGRETVARVAAGAVAQMLLKSLFSDLEVVAFVKTIGRLSLSKEELKEARSKMNMLDIERFPARFPSFDTNNATNFDLSNDVVKLLTKAKNDGLTYGSCVEAIVRNVPKCLGQPVFHKLKADLAFALMGIGAATAWSLGAGFESTKCEGEEFHQLENMEVYGGIKGGLTTGEHIIMDAAFKPPSTMRELAKKGRHDPCIGPRVVPVVEAMIYLVLADHVLWSRLDRLF